MIKNHQHDDPPDAFFEQHQRAANVAKRLLRIDLAALTTTTQSLVQSAAGDAWTSMLLDVAARLYEMRLSEARLQMRLGPSLSCCAPPISSYPYVPVGQEVGPTAAGTWIKGPWVLHSDTDERGQSMFEVRCAVCTKSGGFSSGPGARPILAEALPDACPQCGSS